MISSHLRAGDVLVLLVLALLVSSLIYGVLLVAVRPRRSVLGKLSRRTAAGVVTRGIGGRFARMGWQSWN